MSAIFLRILLAKVKGYLVSWRARSRDVILDHLPSLLKIWQHRNKPKSQIFNLELQSLLLSRYDFLVIAALNTLAKLAILQTAIHDELVARGFTTKDGVYSSKLIL